MLLYILYLPVSGQMDKWINHFFQKEYVDEVEEP